MRILPILLSAISCLALFSEAGASVKLKDLVEVEGVRGNDLVGYGLVVGLDGTGDGLRNIPYTEEALSSLLERLGVNVQGEEFRPKNVAAVLVTATLPPFARAGSRIDVTVSAIGDSTNLNGGMLVMTPLNAADGNIYAVAQGPVLVSGFSAEGDAASVTEGIPTAATIRGPTTRVGINRSSRCSGCSRSPIRTRNGPECERAWSRETSSSFGGSKTRWTSPLRTPPPSTPRRSH